MHVEVAQGNPEVAATRQHRILAPSGIGQPVGRCGVSTYSRRVPTLLHISDLHRTADPRVSNDELLAAISSDAARWESEGIPRPDLLVVSGDSAVALYAADYSVSTAEAARRLGRIQPLHELMAAIREAESGRVAGWGIDHSPAFGGWVLLSGTEAPTGVSAAIVEANTDLKVRTGAAHSYSELLQAKQALRDIGPVGQVDDLGDSLTDALDMITFTAVDMAANAVEIGIAPPPNSGNPHQFDDTGPVGTVDETFETHAAAFAAVIAPHITVAHRIVDGRGLRPHKDFIGGQATTYCTAGFTAQRGTRYGIVTAGHCPDTQSMNGIALEFITGYNSVTADAQFHAVPSGSGHVVKDNYLCGAQSSTECDVSGRRSRLRMVGDFVCHTGKRSGTTCGTVDRIDYSPNYQSVGKDACLNSRKQPITCAAVFVRVTGDYLRQCPGDSGGPWFRHGIAYGVHMGGTGDSCTEHGVSAHFSAILEVENFLGVSVLTSGDWTVP